MNEIENIQTIATVEPEAIEEQVDLNVEVEQTEADELQEQGEDVEQIVPTTLTLEQIVDQILEASGKTEYTLYGVHTVLNAVLDIIGATKEGKDYRVRSQMMYNYNRNKMVVPKQVVDMVTVSQTRAFVIKFATKFVK